MERLVSIKTILMVLSLMVIQSVYATDISETLRQLDRIVAERENYEAPRRSEIERIKGDLATASTAEDRYNVLRALYKEYRTFRIDSAIIVANERLELARQIGDPSKEASATLNLAESYVKSGLADKAIYLLDTLNKESLEDYHRKYVNNIYRNAYSLKAATEMLPSDRMQAQEMLKTLRQQALEDSPKDSRSRYMIEAEKLMDAGLYSEAVAKIEEADRIFDFSKDAPMQYTMGEIYLKSGKRIEAERCLANASIIDLSSGTKEYRSLILLASMLFEDGDVERAFDYINCSFEDMHFSNANFRTPEIMESMPVIDQAFHAYEKERTRLIHTFLWGAAILVVLLAVSVLMLWKTLRANRKITAAMAEMNGRLEERNRALEEADQLKLQNINMLMMSNARYISRLKDYRKSVYRLMKTGQYDKALDALKSDRTDSKDIMAFHEMFDESFLSMFPNFTENVNRLLKQPIALKEPNRLTPELRVMALMRLGLSSTEEIAGMLHYSSQTVYNLRSAIRGMAILPRPEFEEALRQL